MEHKLPNLLCLLMILIISTTFITSHAEQTTRSVSETPDPDPSSDAGSSDPTVRFIISGILSFFIAAVSSAGGLGGGGLLISILTIVAGIDLKTASVFSAFMVSGGSLANLGCHMLPKQRLIDFDIALLTEPLMLLGVSIGVICNLMFPDWLITSFFVVFLGFCTFKTCGTGVKYWRMESQELRRRNVGLEDGSTNVPLLSSQLEEDKMEIPVVKIVILMVIWFSFLLLYLLQGNRQGQGIIRIEPCGSGYWIISSIQVPLAILFTALILYGRRNQKKVDSIQQEDRGDIISYSPGNYLIFPAIALLVGILGGVFGIGGGMLISPLLLQVGRKPEVAAATCSFMVFFTSTMSATQYLLLGMEHIYEALSYALLCFVASLVGLTVVRRAITKHGRASLIVLSVGTELALSTVLMTNFGAMDVWRDYTTGKSMGFNKPC